MKKLVVSVMAIIVGAIFLKPFTLWGFDVIDSLDVGDTSVVSALSNNLKENPYENIATSYKGQQNVTARNVTSRANNNTGYAKTKSDEGYGSVAYDSIYITGKTLPVVTVNSTVVDSGNQVNKYGDRFYYGHNSGAVFGGLVNLGEGSTFSVTLGGTTVNYRVAKKQVFQKNRESGRLQLNGAGNYMWNVALARHNGVQYDISLMTCHGIPYGDGDASERLVLFANRI